MSVSRVRVLTGPRPSKKCSQMSLSPELLITRFPKYSRGGCIRRSAPRTPLAKSREPSVRALKGHLGRSTPPRGAFHASPWGVTTFGWGEHCEVSREAPIRQFGLFGVSRAKRHLENSADFGDSRAKHPFRQFERDKRPSESLACSGGLTL